MHFGDGKLDECRENHIPAMSLKKNGHLLLNIFLMREETPQREHDLREVFNGLR